jgi:hypothetical protein
MENKMYCVYFDKPQLEVYAAAVLGKIAVSKAEKFIANDEELSKLDLGQKVTVRIV